MEVAPVVELLNRALRSDRIAMTALVKFGVVCNRALTEDPQITTRVDEQNGQHYVGALGLINGLLASLGATGRICAVTQDERLVQFIYKEAD